MVLIGGVHLSVRGEGGKEEQLGRAGGDGSGEREMADACLLGCEAQQAKLNGPAAKKKKGGRGESEAGPAATLG
jgi:hypothetical protein